MGRNRCPLKFKEHVEAAIFKDSMGIKQYIVKGLYIEGIPIDIEHKLIIQSGWLEIRRNNFIIYNEKIHDIIFV